MDSQAVAEAFRRSTPHVDRLRLLRGPWDTPAAPIIENVCATLWERQGKRLRSHLVYWFGELVGLPAESLHVYSWAAEAIHTATLLHDDIIDRADTRRGKPSANRIFDNTLPILSGDYLLSDAVQQVAARGDGRVLQALCRTLKELVSGEALQYEARYTIPAELSHFEKVARLKTTSLLRWAALAGPTIAEKGVDEVGRFAEGFGALYQFCDDLLDVVGCATKTRWNDLHEGKLNYVTWHLVQDDPDLRTALMRAFAEKSIGRGLVARFERAASDNKLAPIRSRLVRLARETEAAITPFPDSPTKQALRGLVALCLDRMY